VLSDSLRWPPRSVGARQLTMMFALTMFLVE